MSFDEVWGSREAERLSCSKESSSECFASFNGRADIFCFLPLRLLAPMKVMIDPLAANTMRKYIYSMVIALLLTRIRTSYADESERDFQPESRHPA